MYRYIGNKTKLLPQITERIHEMIGKTGTGGDIMAGTGSVGWVVSQGGGAGGAAGGGVMLRKPRGAKTAAM